jgi:hypothetical protein
MRALRLLGLAVLMAGATWLGGWWTLPLCAAGFALFARGTPHVTLDAGLAAMLAWGGLLAIQATQPAFGRLAAAVRGAVPVPTVALLAITLVFAGVLGASAAAVVRER